MARIKNQVLGDINGSIAPVVFKKMRKTQYVASELNSFIPDKDPASIFRRWKL